MPHTSFCAVNESGDRFPMSGWRCHDCARCSDIGPLLSEIRRGGGIEITLLDARLHGRLESHGTVKGNTRGASNAQFGLYRERRGSYSGCGSQVVASSQKEALGSRAPSLRRTARHILVPITHISSLANLDCRDTLDERPRQRDLLIRNCCFDS